MGTVVWVIIIGINIGDIIIIIIHFEDGYPRFVEWRLTFRCPVQVGFAIGEHGRRVDDETEREEERKGGGLRKKERKKGDEEEGGECVYKEMQRDENNV